MAAMSSADEMICPPPGKSGPRMCSSSSAVEDLPFERTIATAAAATSARWCDGISVAMPTAMPDAPLSSTNGSRAGSSSGSVLDPS